ncbi:MAG: hypothetical protein ACPGLV_15090 [Bacteroidia bacterium]
MKVLLLMIILTTLTACSTVSKYHHKVEKSNSPIVKFSCDLKGKVIIDSVIELSSQNIKNCFQNKDKVLWLRYWVPYCGDNSTELELLKKYSERIELVWIAVLWDYKTIRQQIEATNYPVYYLDRELPKNRIKAVNAFSRQLVKSNCDQFSSNLFIKNGQLLHQCYTNSKLESVVDSLMLKN